MCSENPSKVSAMKNHNLCSGEAFKGLYKGQATWNVASVRVPANTSVYRISVQPLCVVCRKKSVCFTVLIFKLKSVGKSKRRVWKDRVIIHRTKPLTEKEISNGKLRLPKSHWIVQLCVSEQELINTSTECEHGEIDGFRIKIKESSNST